MAQPSILTSKGGDSVTRQYAFWYVLLFVIALLGPALSAAMNGRIGSGQLVAFVVALVIPIPLIWIARKMGYPIGEAVHCSRCGAEMPMFRKPASVSQGVWGGYKCPNCGAELDAKGREITADAGR